MTDSQDYFDTPRPCSDERTPAERNVAILYDEIFAALMQTRQLSAADARAASEHITHRLRERFGGARAGRRGFYLPSPSLAERNAQIAAEFRGRNARELARKWNMHVCTIYKILKKTRQGSS